MKAETKEPKENKSARLPKAFLPERYEIDMIFDHKTLKYDAEVNIDILVNEDSPKELVLNALLNRYSIEALSLIKTDENTKEEVEIAKTFMNDEEDERIYIVLDQDLKKDEKLQLKLKIKGKILYEKTYGLYYCFWDPEIQKAFDAKPVEDRNRLYERDWRKYSKDLIVSLTAESAEFRSLIPSFDEPNFKAVFSFNISFQREYVESTPDFQCMSNGELLDSSLDEQTGLITYEFADSKKMSSYLFTFVFGSYHIEETFVLDVLPVKERRNDNHFRLRVYLPPDRKEDGETSLRVGRIALKYFGKYFNYQYYHPKMDMVCLPNFDSRGLECLGCIVFHNMAMLYGKDQAYSDKVDVTFTICHETSHMWFGDLVTMDWWNDLWLNEAFARIFEYISLEQMHLVKIDVWERFVKNIFTVGLEADEGAENHPINVKVPSVREIDTIFDNITYQKGGAVIRMLLNYVGYDAFKEAMRLYVQKFAYKNTTADDLWGCFDEILKEEEEEEEEEEEKETKGNQKKEEKKDSIKEIMNNWINVPGHPKVTAELLKRKEGDCLHLKQEEDVEGKGRRSSSKIWNIPLFIKTKGVKHEPILFNTKDMYIELKDLGLTMDDITNKNDFIIINDSLCAFYRSIYSKEMSDAILENYKNTLKEDQEDKDNTLSVNEIDIYGILKDKKKAEDYNGILDILEAIKPVSDSNLLFDFTYELYFDLLEMNCPNLGMEEYTKNDNKKELDELTEEFRQFIEYDNEDIKDLKDRIFLKKEPESEGEEAPASTEADIISEDQIDAVSDAQRATLLKYLCIILKNEELIKYILDNYGDYEKNFGGINGNFKLPVYEIINRFCNEYKPEKEVEYFLKKYKDYNPNEDLKYFVNFDYASDEVVAEFFKKNFAKNISPLGQIDLGDIATNNASIKKLCFIFIQMLRKEYDRKTEGNGSQRFLLKFLIDCRIPKTEEEIRRRRDKFDTTLTSKVIGLLKQNLDSVYADRETKNNFIADLREKLVDGYRKNLPKNESVEDLFNQIFEDVKEEEKEKKKK